MYNNYHGHGFIFNIDGHPKIGLSVSCSLRRILVLRFSFFLFILQQCWQLCWALFFCMLGQNEIAGCHCEPSFTKRKKTMKGNSELEKQRVKIAAHQNKCNELQVIIQLSTSRQQRKWGSKVLQKALKIEMKTLKVAALMFCFQLLYRCHLYNLKTLKFTRTAWRCRPAHFASIE